MNHNGGDNRDVTYFFLHITKEHLTQFSKKLIVKSFPQLETLVVVPLNPEDYSYKNLMIKKKDFKEFKLIYSLGINRVGVDDLPNDVFNHLTQLTALNLGSNKISNLPFNLLDSLPELRILVLNDNKIEEIPKEFFDNNKALAHLELTNNPLKKIYPDLRSLPLEVLKYKNSFPTSPGVIPCSHGFDGRKTDDPDSFEEAIEHSELYCK
jgi:Leucine-rich repeat (LRR) protein